MIDFNYPQDAWASRKLASDQPEGATPIDPNEANGLLLTHITTQGELNRWEQDNIIEALAWIHPFPNGNGRHARLMADIFIENVLHGSHFTWGKRNLSNPGENRSRYINALHEADNGNYIPLLEFAKS